MVDNPLGDRLSNVMPCPAIVVLFSACHYLSESATMAASTRASYIIDDSRESMRHRYGFCPINVENVTFEGLLDNPDSLFTSSQIDRCHDRMHRSSVWICIREKSVGSRAWNSPLAAQ